MSWVEEHRANGIITVWLDGVADSAESTGVTKWSSGNVSGMQLTAGTLSVGSNQNTSLTVTNMNQYDNDQDEDIMHDGDSGGSSGKLAVDDDSAYASDIIDILSGDTLTINNTGSEQLVADDVVINGTLAASGASAFTIAGSWDNNSVFTASTSTVTFTATSGTETIDNTGAGTHTFYALIFGQTSGSATWNLGSVLDVDNNLTISYGTLGMNGSNNITLGGNLQIDANGGYTSSTGTFTFDGTGTSTWTDSTSAVQNLGTVVIDGTTKTVNLGSSAKATQLSIGADDAFGLGSSGYTFSLTGSGTGVSRPFVNSGTLTSGTNSTFKFLGTTASDIQNATYDNLTLAPSGGSNPTYTLMAGTIATDNFIIGDGVNAVTIDWNTNDPTLNVEGNFTLSASTTWTKSTSATLTLMPDGTKTWTDSNSTKQDVGIVSIDNGKSTPIINLGSSVSATSVNIDTSMDAGPHELSHNGSNTLTLTGSTGSPLTISGGTFTASTGTVIFNGNGSITIEDTTYNNLTFNPVLTAGVGNITYTGGGATVIGGTWSVNPSGSANSLTYTFGGDITGNPVLTITRTGGSATSAVNTSGSGYALTATSIDIQTGGTFTANGSTVTLIGTSGSPLTATGTFTVGTSTVIFNGNGNITIENTTYNNLTFSPTLTAGVGNITYTGGGATVINSAWNVNPSGSRNILTYLLAGAITGNPTITITRTGLDASSVVDTDAVGNYPITATRLDIQADGDLIANNSGITLVGTSGTLFTLSGSGTFTAGSSIVTMNPDAAVTLTSGTFTGSNAFYTLELSPTITADRIYTFGAGAIEITGSFTIPPSDGCICVPFPILTVNMGASITESGSGTTIGAGNAPTVLNTTGSNYALTVAALTIGDFGTLTGNASAMDSNGTVTISSGGILTSTSGTFYIAGNYTNSGTFTHSNGAITLDGGAKQTLAGTITGAGAFYDLTITNSSGADDPGCGTSFTPSVDFNVATTVSNNYTIITPSVRVEYQSGATYTFTNINWNGQASGTRIFFRNSSLSSGTWLLKVTGTQTVSYVNVARSDASVSGGSTINATDGTSVDCNNNTNWDFTAAGSTITFDLDASVTDANTATPYVVAFGTISTSTVRRSGATQGINYIWIDIDTNASSGAVVTVVSSNASLKSTSVGGDTIPSSTGTMSAGTANYGLCLVAVSESAGGPLAKVSPYNGATCIDGAANTIGLVDGTARNILNTSGTTITAGRGQISVNSAVSAVTPAHSDYTDTLTFIATGTF